MKQFAVLFSAIVAIGVMGGCATPGHVPAFQETAIEPSEISPEGQAAITAQIRDQHEIVERVEVQVVGDDPENAFELTQVEEGPTSVWTREVDVPYNVPAGEYTVRFTAYDSRGEVVLVQDETGSDQPLQATTQMRVVMPEDELPEAAVDPTD